MSNELGHMLDERGVEWEHEPIDYGERTCWKTPDGKRCSYNDPYLGFSKPSLTVDDVTPEQAIAVTLGIGRASELVRAINAALRNESGTLWVGDGETLVDHMVTLGVYGHEVYDGACPWESDFTAPYDVQCEWALVHSGPLYNKYRCGNCGYEHIESRTDAGATELDPNFCPRCGKAVKR